MIILEKEFDIPPAPRGKGLLAHLEESISARLGPSLVPIRLAVVRSGEAGCHCEVGVIEGLTEEQRDPLPPLFRLIRRWGENTSRFNVALVIPTGVGCILGGHAGDANPVAKLFGSLCDTLITHPNVVNASDINELPENGLYVEGSVLSRLLMGTAGLNPVRNNRVLAVVDDHDDPAFTDAAINSVSAARASYGLCCPRVVRLNPRIRVKSLFAPSGRAAGRVEEMEGLLQVLREYRQEYDAVALSTQIDVPFSYHSDYYTARGDMINPWGGVEAMLTHSLSLLFGVPTAHSPMFESQEVADLELGVVDPRMAAEDISIGYFLCVLKGLQHSPRIVPLDEAPAAPGVLTAADISALVIPDGCLGLPTLAALEQGIPVIAVRENRNLMQNDLSALPWRAGQLHTVENYWEAAGVLCAIRSGIDPASVRRPFADTTHETRRFPPTE